MKKLYFILGTIVVGVVALMVTAQVRKAIRIAAEKEPDFGSIQSPALTGVLTNADAFWKYVTAPETPYDLRMAAVVQAGNILPMQDWPRLVNAQHDLQKELELHGWGLANTKVYRWNADWLLPEFAQKSLPRERKILGHTWIVPNKANPYPVTHKERCEAPWPWQVQQALRNYRFPSGNS